MKNITLNNSEKSESKEENNEEIETLSMEDTILAWKMFKEILKEDNNEKRLKLQDAYLGRFF
jgi:hypothetical protein